MKWFQTATLGLTLLLTSGCASTFNQDGRWLYPPMAVPLQANPQQEVQIARLSQLLLRPNLSDEVRAKMLFERGNYYDSLGMRSLARLDYNQSLSFDPAQPELFNLLGVYYTEVGEYDLAYEAFDSTLELDPENSYAARNRAIALYYGDRIDLALEEINTHYSDSPSDPFRALWTYIIQYEKEPEQATKTLTQQYQARDTQWGWMLVGISLGQISEEEAFRFILTESRGDNTLLAQRLTEAYFYLGKRYQRAGEFSSAIAMYKLAISFNVYEYVEHRYAFLELGRIFEQVQAERIAQAKIQ